jgi:CTP:molybdopterin cytidylyltransferase MocA
MTVPATALIVAGGRGTRLLPLTAQVPKPMLPFCGAPFLAGLARRLGAAGVRHIGLVVGADTRPFAPLVDLLAPHGLEVSLVPEPTPLDTAGGVRAATQGLDEAVLVLNGDVLSDLDIAALVATHDAAAAAVTIALTRVADTSTFGVCVLEGDRITAFVEKPAPGSLAGHDTVNAGAYVLAAGVLDPFAAGPLSFEREVFPTLLTQGRRSRGTSTTACGPTSGRLTGSSTGSGSCSTARSPGHRSRTSRSTPSIRGCTAERTCGWSGTSGSTDRSSSGMERSSLPARRSAPMSSPEPEFTSVPTRTSAMRSCPLASSSASGASSATASSPTGVVLDAGAVCAGRTVGPPSLPSAAWGGRLTWAA